MIVITKIKKVSQLQHARSQRNLLRSSKAIFVFVVVLVVVVIVVIVVVVVVVVVIIA